MIPRALAVLPQNTRGMPFEEVKKINQTYTLKALEQIEEARAAKGQKGKFRFLYISGPDTPRTPDGPTPPVFKEYIRLKVCIFLFHSPFLSHRTVSNTNDTTGPNRS